MPRDEAAAKANKEDRRARGLKINEKRRHLQGVAIEKSPDKIITGGYQEFVFSGLAGATAASLVLTDEGVDLPAVDLWIRPFGTLTRAL